MRVNIWSSGYDGTRMKKKNVVEKMNGKMDDGYGLVLYAFPAHFRDLSPVSI